MKGGNLYMMGMTKIDMKCMKVSLKNVTLTSAANINYWPRCPIGLPICDT